MNMRLIATVGLGFLCVLPQANALLIGGVDFPQGAVSFADAWVSFAPGAHTIPPYDNPALALGLPDYPTGAPGNGHTSLGWSGELVLRFIDNSLTTSGDAALDLWIFEVGPAVEPTSIDISTNGINWISVGSVGGATSGIDIDAYIGPGAVTLWAQYSFVRLTDLDFRLSGSPFAGADIDAVGAISSAPPVPEPASLALLGIGVAGIALRRLRRFQG